MRTNNTDFLPLKPGSYARHTGKASEREAMAEGSGVPVAAGSRPGVFGRPVRPKGLSGRDLRVAAAALARKER